MKAIRIWWLKRKLRSSYWTFHNLKCGDGGARISNIISGGRISRAAKEFNATLRELKKIDPNANGVPEIKEHEL